MLFSRPRITLGSTSPLPFSGLHLAGKDLGLHATVWGRTGSGKSKLLQSVFTQQIKAGLGVGLIEPHHDLSYDSLAQLASAGFFRRPEAFDRLIYLDWGNGAYLPFNVLKSRHDPHSTALHVLEAMLRVWPELVSAPMFQTLFLSAIMVLIANELPLTFLYQLLSDPDFRATCLRAVGDPLVIQSFSHYDRLGRDQAQLAGSTLRRAFLLMFSPAARYTLGQPDNWLDIRAIMDAGKGLIINLGNVQDADTRRLLGALLMVQIEQAALSRTDLAPSQRRPFTLLVDEWPSFAAQGETIGTILSQTRKFNLRLWLAAQSLSQVSSDRLSGAIENCRLSVVFGLGRDSAVIQARHVGRADPEIIKDAPRTDTQHPQYYPVAEQFERWTQQLQNLPPRVALVKLYDRAPVKIRTLTVPPAKVSSAQMATILATYRRRYQRTPAEAQAVIARLSASRSVGRSPPPASAPEGISEDVLWFDPLPTPHPVN